MWGKWFRNFLERNESGKLIYELYFYRFAEISIPYNDDKFRDLSRSNCQFSWILNNITGIAAFLSSFFSTFLKNSKILVFIYFYYFSNFSKKMTKTSKKSSHKKTPAQLLWARWTLLVIKSSQNVPRIWYREISWMKEKNV